VYSMSFQPTLTTLCTDVKTRALITGITGFIVIEIPWITDSSTDGHSVTITPSIKSPVRSTVLKVVWTLSLAGATNCRHFERALN